MSFIVLQLTYNAALTVILFSVMHRHLNYPAHCLDLIIEGEQVLELFGFVPATNSFYSLLTISIDRLFAKKMFQKFLEFCFLSLPPEL